MWEKTVMSDEQIRKLFEGKKLLIPYADIPLLSRGFVNVTKEAQAEITGEIAYQEGIRKVVEWLDSHNNSDVDLEVLTAEWQAFKKENGL